MVLSPADEAVVTRDAQLTALRTLLDPGALADLLSERLGAPCEVTVRRLRHKPGTSCVMAFDLRTPAAPASTPCIAKAYAPKATTKWKKSLHEVSDEHILLSEPGWRLVVTTLAGDRHLSAVGRLFDADARPSLLARLLPDSHLGGGGPTTLRHNPERRWVGVLDDGTEPRFLLRAYRPSSAGEHIRAYSTLGGTAPATPPLVGKSRRHGMLAVVWAAGTTLPSSAPAAQFTEVGHTLARFHRRRPPRLVASTPSDHAAQTLQAAQQVAWLLPDEATRVAELAEDICCRLHAASPGNTLLHGDFSPDQVVVGPDGSLTFIDLDAACLGHPAQDLASVWAALLLDTGLMDETPAAERSTALLTGYDEVAPTPEPHLVDAYRDSYLLRRAAEYFRTRHSDWPRQTSRVLALIERGATSTQATTGDVP